MPFRRRTEVGHCSPVPCFGRTEDGEDPILCAQPHTDPGPGDEDRRKRWPESAGACPDGLKNGVWNVHGKGPPFPTTQQFFFSQLMLKDYVLKHTVSIIKLLLGLKTMLFQNSCLYFPNTILKQLFFILRNMLNYLKIQHMK